MSYILLVDDELEILEILEMNIEILTKHPVKSAVSGNDALAIIDQAGEPLIVISDYRMPNGDGLFLYQELKKRLPQVPFVICSGNPIEDLRATFPEAFSIMCKPSFIKPLKEVIAKRFPPETAPLGPVPEYVKVPVSFLVRLGVLEFNALIKLSEEKYVKIHSKGELFDKSDADKIHMKELDHLYVSKSDLFDFSVKFEKFLIQKSKVEDDVKSETAYDLIEVITSFSRALGWRDETVLFAQKAVDVTLKLLKNEKSWKAILQRKNANGAYNHHISLQAILTCLVAQGIGWKSESTLQKLVMASLLHDFSVDEDMYEDLLKKDDSSWALEQSRIYRQHPIKVSELAKTLKGLPIDVDIILLQHHERPDSTGFPRGLDARHISPLSALFIICEDLIHFSFNRTINKDLLDSFWVSRPEFLDRDPFKKISLSMMSKGKL